MDQNDFVITKEKNMKSIKFVLKGRVNSINADYFQSELDQMIQEMPASIVLNMFNVSYLSSAGLKVILKAYKDIKEAGGSLGIETPSENVKNILNMTALDGLLVI